MRGRVMGDERARFALFAAVGLSGVSVNAGVMRAALSLGCPPLAASLLASLGAMGSNFFLNDRVTWRGRARTGSDRRAQVIRYFAIAIVGIAITSTVMETGRGLGLSPILSQVAGVAVSSVLSFLLHNRFTFGRVLVKHERG